MSHHLKLLINYLLEGMSNQNLILTLFLGCSSTDERNEIPKGTIKVGIKLGLGENVRMAFVRKCPLSWCGAIHFRWRNLMEWWVFEFIRETKWVKGYLIGCGVFIRREEDGEAHYQFINIINLRTNILFLSFISLNNQHTLQTFTSTRQKKGDFSRSIETILTSQWLND